MFTRKIFSFLSFLLILVLTFNELGVIPVHAAGIRYAMPNGTGDCSTWTNACTFQTALSGAVSGDEIWVMSGMYKPTTGSDRSATFQLKDNVAVYGGFAGTETELSQRLPTNITILSGDLLENDNNNVRIDEPTRADNSYHVVTGATGATLDGFTITAGNASDSAAPNNRGGGIYNTSSNPILINITFSKNSAAFGAGMSNSSSSPMLTNITFSDNSTLKIGNAGTMGGGGIYNYLSSPTLTNVTFSNNSALQGGGIYNSSSSPTLTNVTLSGNSAAAYGGGIFDYNGINIPSRPMIHNAIFWGNTATSGAQIYENDTSYSTVNYSVVQNGCTGTGAGSLCTDIITSDPLLGLLDNHGGFTPSFPLETGSSAIDSGSNGYCPATDQRGIARPQDGDGNGSAICDIGSYEVSLASNNPPTISGIGDKTTNEDTATGNIAFTVDDLETPAASLIVTATSSNTTLVPGGNITLGGSGTDRTIDILPAVNQSGTTTITVTVDDGTATAGDAFLLTVNAVNDPPTISDIPDQVVNEGSPTGDIAFSVSDVETSTVSLIVTASSSNTLLVPDGNITLGGSGTNRTIDILPVANQSGTSTITVTVDDGTDTASDIFLLTVNAGQNEYTLTILSVHGTVIKDPEKATYHEGETVSLTAIPDPGWSFSNWTGGLNSTANPGILTIHGNTSVTANYVQTGPIVEQWTPNVKVNDDTGTATQSSPTIIADEEGNLFLAWGDRRDSQKNLYFASSFDGGSTWSANVKINDYDNSLGEHFIGFARDAGGILYIAWDDTRNGDYDIYFSKSADNGATWSTNVRVSDEPDPVYAWAPTLAVDNNGILYLAWTDDRNGYWDNYFSKSTDGGMNWTSSVKVNDDVSATSGGRTSKLVLDNNGGLYLAWYTGYTGNDSRNLYLSASADGGASWGARVRINDIADQVWLSSPPGLAIDGEGNLYALWIDNRNVDWDKGHIYFAKSLDGGATWSENVDVSNNPDGTGTVYAMGLVINSIGDLSAIWGDNREGSWDVYFTRSADGGANWDPGSRVNDNASMEQNQTSLAIDGNDNLYAAWTDARNGNPDIYSSQWHINHPPAIAESGPVQVTISRNSLPTPFNLTLHADDADAHVLTWSIASPALHGTASAAGTGNSKTIGYTPNTNFEGSDSFVVQVDDGNGGIDMITVEVIILFEFKDDFESYEYGSLLPGKYKYQGFPWGGDGGPATPADLFRIGTIVENQVLQYYWDGPSYHFPHTSGIYRQRFSALAELGVTFLHTQHSMGFDSILFEYQAEDDFIMVQTAWDNTLYVGDVQAGQLGTLDLWSDIHIMQLDHRLDIKRISETELQATVTRLDTNETKSLTVIALRRSAAHGYQVGFGFYEDWGGGVYVNIDDFLVKGMSIEDCTISGNAGVAGAIMTYTGGFTTADSNGDYAFKILYGWSGTVTPSKLGYTFSPESRTYNNVFSDQISQDYTEIDNNTPPIVSSIIRAGENPTNASSVDFSISFSKSVDGVTADDLSLTTTGVSGASISGLSGSGTSYTVTVNTGSGNGTIGLDVVDDNSIVDSTGNPLGGPEMGDGNFTGEVYDIIKSAPVPSIPLLLSPANGSLLAVLQQTLDWKDSSPAPHHYQLQVSKNNTFTDLVANETEFLASTFTFASDLDPGRRYFWRVRAFNILDQTKGWSTPWNFRTPLDAPTLGTPACGASLLTDRPAFDWLDVEGAAGYTLQVAPTTSFGTLLLNATVPASKYAMSKDLPQNKTLYWRVKAQTSVVSSPWSVKCSFTTGNPPTVPVLASPANNALLKDYTPTLKWYKSSVPSGTLFKRYELQLDNNSDFSSPEIEFSTTDGLLTETSYTPPSDLAPNTKYYWRVRAVNLVGVEDHVSGWSAVRSFRTVMLPPTLLLPADGSTEVTLKPFFDWEDVEGAASYTIQISTSAGFSTYLVNTNRMVSNFTPSTNLPKGKTLYWRVRANGPNGPSAWSVFQFVTPP